MIFRVGPLLLVEEPTLLLGESFAGWSVVGRLLDGKFFHV